MGDQFYIRLAGRVRGPFTVDGLKEQIRRGVFSAHISEVSEDRTNWMRASQIPSLNELLRPSTTAPPASPVDHQDVAEPESVLWHYTRHGAKVAATVSTEQLDLLIRQGTIGLNERIWNESCPIGSKCHSRNLHEMRKELLVTRFRHLPFHQQRLASSDIPC